MILSHVLLQFLLLNTFDASGNVVHQGIHASDSNLVHPHSLGVKVVQDWKLCTVPNNGMLGKTLSQCAAVMH